MRVHSAVLAILWLASSTLQAADADWNGRWNLTVPENPMHRAWWLEISGAGTPHPAGRFVGFPGGNMLPIPDLTIEQGGIRFHSPKPADAQEYTARLQGSSMTGEMRSPKLSLKFIGKRAPEIRDQDDGTWRPGQPIELFDGKDLEGWVPLLPDRSLGWSIDDAILKSTGHANNIISARKFWNFALHVEYRVAQESNSGVGLRGRYEVQILGDYGEPPNLHGSGALYSRIKPPINASLPPDQWQILDVRLVGRIVTVTLNGHRLIDKQVIEGPTALVMDGNEDQPGPIFLQGDHGPVEFRKVTLTPLTK